MRLNPYHNDWYFAFAAIAHLLAGRLDDGIRLGLKAPHVATDMHALLACGLAHLGQQEEAARHLTAFHRIFRQNITAGTAISVFINVSFKLLNP